MATKFLGMNVSNLGVIYINGNICCRSLNSHSSFQHLELMTIQINQNKCKKFFIGVYKPPSQMDKEFTNRLCLITGLYIPQDENLIVIEDFYLSTENYNLYEVMQAYDLNNLISKPTCFQTNYPAV